MKILLAYIGILPHVGGLSTYVEQLKKGLEMKGHEVEVLTRHPVTKECYLMNRGDSVSLARMDERVNKELSTFFETHPSKLEAWLRQWWELDRYRMEVAVDLLKVKDYDIIHAQCPFTARAMFRIKPSNVPLLLTYHSIIANEIYMSRGDGFQQSLEWKVCALSEYYGLSSCDLIITPSAWLKQQVTDQLQVVKEKITVISNGIDVEVFQKEMKRECHMERPKGKKIMICVSRLVHEKGHRYLLIALQKLLLERTDWICWIVGDGKEKKQLIELTKNLNLQNHVFFLGDRGDVPALLKKADLFVLTSLVENCPYAVMEAQIAGKPVITVDAGGIPEMVHHQKNGLLSTKGDSEGIFENLKLALEDKLLRKKLVVNARKEAVQRWGVDLMVDRTLKVYHEIKKKKGHDICLAKKPSIPDSTIVSELLKLLEKSQ